MSHALPSFLQSSMRLRQIVQLCFWMYLLAAPTFLLTVVDVIGKIEWVLGVLFLVSAFLLFVPWLLVTYVPSFQGRVSERGLAILELLIAAMTIFSWLGSVGLYNVGLGYDSFVHFISSAFGAIIVYGTLVFLHPSWEKYPSLSLFALLVLVVLVGGILIELGEYVGDLVLGTTMYGEVGQADDTQRDLIFDLLGALFGSALVIRCRASMTHYLTS